MTSVEEEALVEGLLDDLVSIRTKMRFRVLAPLFGDDSNRGGCQYLSAHIQAVLGLEQRRGCYCADGIHVKHFWNRSPDGRILDATADQFGQGGHGIRITDTADSRYVDGCDCGGVAVAKILPDGSGVWIEPSSQENPTAMTSTTSRQAPACHQEGDQHCQTRRP